MFYPSTFFLHPGKNNSSVNGQAYLEKRFHYLKNIPTYSLEIIKETFSELKQEVIISEYQIIGKSDCKEFKVEATTLEGDKLTVFFTSYTKSHYSYAGGNTTITKDVESLKTNLLNFLQN